MPHDRICSTLYTLLILSLHHRTLRGLPVLTTLHPIPAAFKFTRYHDLLFCEETHKHIPSCINFPIAPSTPCWFISPARNFLKKLHSLFAWKVSPIYVLLSYSHVFLGRNNNLYAPFNVVLYTRQSWYVFPENIWKRGTADHTIL